MHPTGPFLFSDLPGFLRKYIAEVHRPAVEIDPDFCEKYVNEKIRFLGGRSILETFRASGGEEKVIRLFHRLEKEWGAPYHLTKEGDTMPAAKGKALKKIGKSQIKVFKVRNRRSWAAICMDNLCEGTTPQQAVRRLYHPLRRMGYELAV